jgi:hypothetical protein
MLAAIEALAAGTEMCLEKRAVWTLLHLTEWTPARFPRRLHSQSPPPRHDRPGPKKLFTDNWNIRLLALGVLP